MTPPKHEQLSGKVLKEGERPVGPTMKSREALELFMALAGLDVNKLSTQGQPEDVADLGHVAGVCYELCRVAQAGTSFYDQLVKLAVRDPGELASLIKPIQNLVNGVADGRDFEASVSGFKIKMFSSRIRKPENRRGFMPFRFAPDKFKEGLLVHAVFYLGFSPDAYRIRRCRETACGKVFLAVRGTRVFCSHQCASAVSVRAFRERQKGRPAA